MNLASLRGPLVALARRAGAEIMRIYGSGFDVRAKADSTPVTEADERSEAIVLEGLCALTPGVPAVAEEAMARGEVEWPATTPPAFWLVDPLDGTREFVERNGQFAVNIGLVLDGRPALGVVLQPTTGVAWSGGHGLGAFRAEVDGPERAIRARAKPADGIVVLSSKSHGSSAEAAYCDGEHVREHRRIGSAAKFGLLAEGAGDLYPRFGPTSEWDTAAGEALLVAAGGHVERTDGTLLAYGKRGFRNPDFVARGAW
ncbi:MAG: 3'(2'),5'-bisphosphate nucleotidase CysQ [Tagaea sp.]